jgi:hypothetical protein
MCSVADRQYPTLTSMSPLALPFDSAQGTPVFGFSWNTADRVGERSRTRSVADRQYPTPMTTALLLGVASY